MDTYESTLDGDKQIEKANSFHTYIKGNWNRIFDWREKIDNCPEDAWGMGAKESNQRHISFRMTEFLRNVTRPSIAVNQDSISLNRAHSTAVGQLVKSFR